MTAEIPLVSVIVAAYNAEDTIGACLSGALTQTHPRVEVVVVDDGSTDRTGDVLRAYGSRIRYARQPNSGSSAARNAAFAMARGEFLAFCDADDVLLPTYIEAALSTYRRQGGGQRVVMCEALQLTSTGLAHGRRLIGAHFPRRRQRMAILQKNFVPIFAVFPRQLLNDVPAFSEDLQLVEDWEFWIRTVLSGWSIVFQSDPQAMYRLTPTAKSADVRRHAAEDTIVARVRDEHWEDLTDEERAFVELRLTTPPPRYLDQLAAEALRERRFPDAAALYRQLATLSSEDPRVRVRALLMGHVPGAGRLGRVRQDRIDRRMGGRISAPSVDPPQPDNRE